ncbi:MAG: P1 family peptidase [Vicinamibacteria bacterium]|nr:P1 family peptidase [Vicinamibacteria bacterium]
MGVPLEAQAPPLPVPRTDPSGPAVTFDFPGMRVGVGEYEEGPTGTTVFYFPKGVKAATDVRGGAPGTLNADAVRLAYEAPMMQSVVFSGGSWYGLSAATGVANELKVMRAEQGQHDFIAGVLGAIIFDVGGRRFSRVTPDDRLGAAAVRSAREGWFPLGARGAGRFAMQGVFFLDGPLADASRTWAHSGQGGAFRQIGPTRIAVFTVVNALGAIVDRNGRVLRCRRNVATGDCPAISSLLKDHLARVQRRGGGTGPTGNTTLTLVVTNQKLPYADLQRLGVQVHTSMARAIQPFATEEDGDVLYAVTTDEVDNPSLPSIQLGAIASELAWDAVLNSAPVLPPTSPRTPTTLSAERLAESVGTFAFHGGGTLSVSTGATGLEARFTGDGRMYFAADRTYRLTPIAEDLFLVVGPAEDVIRFDRRAGRIVAITLNPGPWAQSANRGMPR